MCVCVWQNVWGTAGVWVVETRIGWRERERERVNHSLNRPPRQRDIRCIIWWLDRWLQKLIDLRLKLISVWMWLTHSRTHTLRLWDRKPGETNYQFTECLRNLNLNENTWRTGRPATRDKINWEINVLLLDRECVWAVIFKGSDDLIAFRVTFGPAQGQVYWSGKKNTVARLHIGKYILGFG